MKLPKLALVSAIIVLCIALLLFFVPGFAISMIRGQMETTTDHTLQYKLQESIQLWTIYQISVFQPLAIVALVISIVLFVYSIIRWITLNYMPTS
ncbi:MAG: hypothetical protein WHU54_07755 [Candidatus Bathyarchaeia archaeon]